MTISRLLRLASEDGLRRVVRAKDDEWAHDPGYLLLSERRGILGHLEGHGRDPFHATTYAERLPLAAADRDGAGRAWYRLTARLGLPGAVAAVRRAAKRQLGSRRSAAA